MQIARLLFLVIALILIGLVVTYLITYNQRYFIAARWLGLSTATLLLIFFAVLAVQQAA
jgi:hypothetical protein